MDCSPSPQAKIGIITGPSRAISHHALSGPVWVPTVQDLTCLPASRRPENNKPHITPIELLIPPAVSQTARHRSSCPFLSIGWCRQRGRVTPTAYISDNTSRTGIHDDGSVGRPYRTDKLPYETLRVGSVGHAFSRSRSTAPEGQ